MRSEECRAECRLNLVSQYLLWNGPTHILYGTVLWNCCTSLATHVDPWRPKTGTGCFDTP